MLERIILKSLHLRCMSPKLRKMLLTILVGVILTTTSIIGGGGNSKFMNKLKSVPTRKSAPFPLTVSFGNAIFRRIIATEGCSFALLCSWIRVVHGSAPCFFAPLWKPIDPVESKRNLSE